ncbi:MAG TPA: M20 family metallopeptidase, partial [Bacteroidales bacterium]|nr:M20 family metallopeptidase [Bacteroidales bacterium]
MEKLELIKIYKFSYICIINKSMMFWNLINNIEKQAIEWRHYLHANPELSNNEINTAKYITTLLKSWNIYTKTKVAGNGVVGIIEGKNPNGKVIALRADMDALPIEEKTNLEFKSKNTGIMHACGHDAHMANLLATAYILNELRNEWAGKVVLIFEPSEETLPGGAKKIIEEKILENQHVDIIIGMHVSPELPIGTIGYKIGTFMASSDEIYINVKGKSGHAAIVKDFVDPVISSAAIILNLQQIISRFNDPSIPTVLSIGKVIANGRTNVIPSEVHLEGTFRTFDEKWRNEAKILISEIANNTAKAYQTTAEINIIPGYPTLYNDEKLTKEIIKFIN